MFLIFLALNAAADPFWRAKDKVYSRIQNREVIVSVRSEPHDSKSRLVLAGGGQVSAPCTAVRRAAHEYETLAKKSGFVDRARYDPATRTLDLEISAYGYHTDLAVELEMGEDALAYAMVKGPFRGMKGAFRFYPVAGRNRCDVGLEGEYSYDHFPIPQLFLRFGMEVMLQRMAGRLRSHAEELHRESPQGLTE